VPVPSDLQEVGHHPQNGGLFIVYRRKSFLILHQKTFVWQALTGGNNFGFSTSLLEDTNSFYLDFPLGCYSYGIIQFTEAITWVFAGDPCSNNI
jgi:hypothetical protein